MVIQADFSNNSNLEYYKHIKGKLMQIDIGLLVLNAGMGTRDPLGVCDPKLSQNLLDANVYHVAILLKLMLPQLKTKTRCCLTGAAARQDRGSS